MPGANVLPPARLAPDGRQRNMNPHGLLAKATGRAPERASQLGAHTGISSPRSTQMAPNAPSATVESRSAPRVRIPRHGGHGYCIAFAPDTRHNNPSKEKPVIKRILLAGI